MSTYFGFLVYFVLLVSFYISLVYGEDKVFDCKRSNEIQKKWRRLQELKSRMFDILLNEGTENAQAECKDCGCNYGAKGISGPKGEQGPPGNPGMEGIDGFPGEPGLDCIPGPLQIAPPIRGDNGPQGPKGEKGDMGVEGPCECDGPKGCHLCQPNIFGRKGYRGMPGFNGLPGPPGPKGEPAKPVPLPGTQP